MNKLLVICGPTATGKTKLGIELAEKFKAEIISADSRQVYRGMDIGTGKELPVISNLKSQISKPKLKTQNFELGYYLFDHISVWLIDVVEPNYKFNVADYKKCAEVVIEDILRRGKLPILVGGTGFYIKAVTEEIETIGVEPDWELRDKLSNYQIGELRIILEKQDPERLQRMNQSDRQNPRRLIRAIEIALKIKDQKSKIKDKVQSLKLETLFIGLTASSETLYQRIDQRVEERVKMGLEDEIRSLLKKGYSWENSALGTTLAYSEWRDYFEGKASREEIIQKWKFDEHGYARRQMTWFRKNNKINWFDITKQNFQEEVEKRVGNWYIDSKSAYQQNSKRER